MVKVVAAIPAYNEEVSIGSVVLKARQHTDEVIVVDDGSNDATAEVARMAGARVLQHATNLGKGAAIRTAFTYAVRHGVEVLVIHDADMQHNPSQIPEVVRPILEGRADMVIGVRSTRDDGMPLYRRVGKRFLDYATAMAVSGGILTDSQSGFRAFSRAALESLKPSGDGIGVESEMLVQAVERGLRLAEVPVNARYDIEGSTFNPAAHAMQVLGGLMSIVSEKRPLFFFGVPGLVLGLISGLLALHTVQVYHSTGVFAIGYAFLLLLFGVVGVLSIFTGIVLNAIKRMTTEPRPSDGGVIR